MGKKTKEKHDINEKDSILVRSQFRKVPEESDRQHRHLHENSIKELFRSLENEIPHCNDVTVGLLEKPHQTCTF